MCAPDDKEQTYCLSNDVLAIETNGENVLMDYGSGKYFGLRGAAQILIEPLRDGMTFDAMVNAVSRRYGITPADAEKDLSTILPKLLDAGLLLKTDMR